MPEAPFGHRGGVCLHERRSQTRQSGAPRETRRFPGLTTRTYESRSHRLVAFPCPEALHTCPKLLVLATGGDVHSGRSRSSKLTGDPLSMWSRNVGEFPTTMKRCSKYGSARESGKTRDLRGF